MLQVLKLEKQPLTAHNYLSLQNKKQFCRCKADFAAGVISHFSVLNYCFHFKSIFRVTLTAMQSRRAVYSLFETDLVRTSSHIVLHCSFRVRHSALCMR